MAWFTFTNEQIETAIRNHEVIVEGPRLDYGPSVHEVMAMLLERVVALEQAEAGRRRRWWARVPPPGAGGGGK